MTGTGADQTASRRLAVAAACVAALSAAEAFTVAPHTSVAKALPPAISQRLPSLSRASPARARWTAVAAFGSSGPLTGLEKASEGLRRHKDIVAYNPPRKDEVIVTDDEITRALQEWWWDTPEDAPLRAASTVRKGVLRSPATAAGLAAGAAVGFGLAHMVYFANLVVLALKHSVSPWTGATLLKAFEFARLDLAAGHVGNTLAALAYSPKISVVLDVRVVAAVCMAPLLAKAFAPLLRWVVSTLQFLIMGEWVAWTRGMSRKGGEDEDADYML